MQKKKKIFHFQSYPVKSLIPEITVEKLSTTKGFVSTVQFVWNQTKPIFIPPYLDKTVKLCYMVFILFAIGHGTFLW